MRRKDLTNQAFGRLTAISRLTTPSGKKSKWLCRCECGNSVAVALDKITSGHTRSCGCLLIDWVKGAKTTHGHARKGSTSLTYKSWTNMKTRCLNPKAINYNRYGGAGVTICERWLDSFEAFLEDMGPRPARSYSIERIDGTKGYEPDNCVWGTASDQNANKACSRTVTIDGERVPLARACEAFGVKYGTAWMRLATGRQWDGKGCRP